MKGIAIGFSDTSKEILKRLKKTEFINEIYIGRSSQKDKNINISVKVVKPKQILREYWDKLDLIIFVGSLGASIRIINSLLLACFITSFDHSFKSPDLFQPH